jgi:hypothetical protein
MQKFETPAFERTRQNAICRKPKKEDICDSARRNADICDLSNVGSFWNNLRTWSKFVDNVENTGGIVGASGHPRLRNSNI